MAERLPIIQRVDSSSVDAVGYDPASGKLYVRFVGSGNACVYYAVPPSVYDEFMASQSKGRFVNAEIKGAFDYPQL